MAAGQKGERAELCFLHFRRSNFPERGADDKVFGIFLPLPAALLMCTSGGLASALFFYLIFRRSNFQRQWAEGSVIGGSL